MNLLQIGPCQDGLETMRTWTWNDHLGGVDPLGVTDVELECKNSPTVYHGLNQNEPDSGTWVE